MVHFVIASFIFNSLQLKELALFLKPLFDHQAGPDIFISENFHAIGQSIGHLKVCYRQY